MMPRPLSFLVPLGLAVALGGCGGDQETPVDAGKLLGSTPKASPSR